MLFLSDRTLNHINRAVASGRIVPYLALVMLAIASAAALVVWVFARGEFHTFGDSFWWAAQTITTVGYGDVIPETRLSKVVAVFVMFSGIASLSLITALVTSAVVTWSQRRIAEELDDEYDLQLATLRRIEQRLEAIERRLGSSPG
jgi:voltage-gated potassium channel